MKHHIVVSFEKQKFNTIGLNLHLRRCIQAVLEAQSVPVPCEVSVLVTDDKGIQAINLAQRKLDKPTDVLSFPAFQFEPGKLPEDLTDYLDVETGLLPLGDMVISLTRAKAQAKDYGHSLAREIGYLTVHSILHLLGYDHVDEGPAKQQMRAQEEAILLKIQLPR